jgi:hypothetical protein
MLEDVLEELLEAELAEVARGPALEAMPRAELRVVPFSPTEAWR